MHPRFAQKAEKNAQELLHKLHSKDNCSKVSTCKNEKNGRLRNECLALRENENGEKGKNILLNIPLREISERKLRFWENH